MFPYIYMFPHMWTTVVMYLYWMQALRAGCVLGIPRVVWIARCSKNKLPGGCSKLGLFGARWHAGMPRCVGTPGCLLFGPLAPASNVVCLALLL